MCLYGSQGSYSPKISAFERSECIELKCLSVPYTFMEESAWAVFFVENGGIAWFIMSRSVQFNTPSNRIHGISNREYDDFVVWTTSEGSADQNPRPNRMLTMIRKLP